jgi:hypothetical protein
MKNHYSFFLKFHSRFIKNPVMEKAVGFVYYCRPASANPDNKRKRVNWALWDFPVICYLGD